MTTWSDGYTSSQLRAMSDAYKKMMRSFAGRPEEAYCEVMSERCDVAAKYAPKEAA